MYYLCEKLASLVTQVVKDLPAMRETQVQSLSWEDPLQRSNQSFLKEINPVYSLERLMLRLQYLVN